VEVEMYKPMSAEELKNYQGEDDFTEEVKRTIEEVVDMHSSGLREGYLRRYLFSLCEECKVDKSLLDELGGDAAAWSDGWSYCEERDDN